MRTGRVKSVGCETRCLRVCVRIVTCLLFFSGVGSCLQEFCRELCRELRRIQQSPDRHHNPDRRRCEGRAGPARRRATRRSRVGTPLPVLTGPVPKRSVPTRLRRVAHSNGRAIRLGIRTAVNADRRRRATRRSRVGTPLPVPTGPVLKRSVPTRLRCVAHSNGCAIRLGIRTAVNADRRRRATRRSRVGTPLPVPTGPVPKQSVPTRLRRVAHSNGRAIRLGIRTAVNAGRRRRATRRSRVGTPLRRAARARHG